MNAQTPPSTERRPLKSGSASMILQELTAAINRSADPPKVFYAILHYVAATAAIPDDLKAKMLRKLAAEWEPL